MSTQITVAKWSGDLFNEGLYDIHVKLKSVPLLEWTVPQEMYRLKASDIMESCLSYIYPHTRVHSIVGILRTTAHNAFPVVTVDKPVQHNVQEDNFQSNFNFSFNERFARSSTLSSLRSEQKLLQHVSSGEDRMLRPKRGRTSSDLILQNEHLEIKRKRVQSESARDYLTDSSSVPELPSFIDRGMRRIHFKDEGFPGSAERHSEEDEPKGLMFHGIILRSQLVTLLKKRVFYSENSERLTCTELDFASMTEDYPRFPDIHDLHIEFEDQQKIMDVTTYMNPCPYMVFPWTPVPLVFNLFRTMGLRHLIVINTKGQLVGMITRFNLTHEYMEYCLENQNGD